MEYYKIKNSNGTLEYTVDEKLSRIIKQLDNRQNSFISCVFSAVIANIVTISWNLNINSVRKMLAFIGILFFAYIIFLLLFKLKEFSCIWIKRRFSEVDEDVMDEQELHVKDVYYHKISNDLVQGISLVNKVKRIVLDPNCKKEDLIVIYMYQAKHCFEEILREMKQIVFVGNSDKEKNYCNAIGFPALLWTCATMMKYLKELSDLCDKGTFDDVQEYKKDVEAAKEGYEKMKKRISCFLKS